MERNAGTPTATGEAERDRARGRRSTLLGLLVNAVLVVVKVAAGLLGHSSALIADGIESTTDIFSSLIVWRGLVVSGRAADARHHFGYGKAEAVASAVVSMMLLAAAGGIAVQALRELVTPHDAPAGFTLVVLAVVIVVKELLFRRVVAVGDAIGSTAVKVDAWHHRSDAITSAAAFVGIAIAVVGGPGWAAADEYAALVAAVIIAVNGVRFLRVAVADLMDRAPDADVLEAIRRTAGSVDGVLGIEKVLARRVGMGYHVVMHVEADPALPLHDAHVLGGKVRRTLTRQLPFVVDAVIHMEPSPAAGAASRAGDGDAATRTPRRTAPRQDERLCVGRGVESRRRLRSRADEAGPPRRVGRESLRLLRRRDVGLRGLRGRVHGGRRARTQDCRVAARLTLEFDCNWKFIVENLMDVYHVRTLHYNTFGQYTQVDESNFTYMKNGGVKLRYTSAPATPGGRSLFGKMPALSSEPDNFAALGYLCPNFQIFVRMEWCEDVLGRGPAPSL